MPWSGRLIANRPTSGSVRLWTPIDNFRPCLVPPSRFAPRPEIIRNTQESSRAELVEDILDHKAMGSESSDMWMHKLWVDVVTTPWELARTGRAFRLLYASKIQEAKTEPWNADRKGWFKFALITGSPGGILDPATLHEIEWSTPLVQTILPPIYSYLDYWDHNEVERRAFVQILSLRVWQLRHDGRLPESLQELVTTGILDKLPAHPDTPGGPFGYVRSSGQALLPLGELGPLRPGYGDSKRLQPTSDSWLLYSVGPDRQDDACEHQHDEYGRRRPHLPAGGVDHGAQKASPH